MMELINTCLLVAAVYMIYGIHKEMHEKANTDSND